MKSHQVGITSVITRILFITFVSYPLFSFQRMPRIPSYSPQNQSLQFANKEISLKNRIYVMEVSLTQVSFTHLILV